MCIITKKEELLLEWEEEELLLGLEEVMEVDKEDPNPNPNPPPGRR